MTVTNTDKAGATSLEAIARNGSMLRRMAVRIPTYLSDLRENPAWLPMFVLARTMPARRMHWRGAKPVRASQNGRETMFVGVNRQDVVDALQSDGLFSGLVLPKFIHEEIAAFVRCTPCFGNFDRRLEFMPADHAEAEARFGRPLLSGHYFERILGCKAALAVQNDPLLMNIAAHYLGGQAKLITTRVWWSFPTGQASDADRNLASLGKYHFDLDDWRMLKFFFYLLPVDEGTGPHVYVRGSHRRRALKHQLTLLVGHPAEEILDVYGEQSPVTLIGEAGLGFVEDPFGFHMGTVPAHTPRLMMEVGFGVSPPSRRRFHGEPVIR
ncbi:hypothetical protein RFM41_30195 [Mesorhizobium sp. VK25A]|uniref:Phytanoyl-CoA dioxygenase (PhyH) n=7 Tax=Mesorhizobium TaxID=68287 RepID=A0ABU5ADA3_9HYPH|nr:MULTISPECIES: hypothetical protein [Mesorhizobium]MDX8437157.1 hypothetical protein [Mesorhizobium abyssinicae]MDX8443243.1 hypothetical protein [Mesorhizobium sp. VK3E]MDX8469048.1 hypothetical protein [Mesorhizobium sp. VK23B]MDX8475412.1 hypothetical protein [Mesorhizobium sp. VK23A]MDX8480809.1 hypothetical protein [Mesorhizobium sp. VK24D]